jgi:hypothetical protein
MIEREKIRMLGTMNLNKFYGNIKVYSPEGILMFKGNEKKINWYLNKNLAEVIEVDSNNKPTAIRLNFVPGGIGHLNDEFFLSSKENICVVSGQNNLNRLTKHHVVPYMYRKWFPLEFKSKNSHDVLLIDAELHFQYEKEANKLKDMIAKDLELPTLKEYSNRLKRKAAYSGMARAILNPDILFENKIDICIKFQQNTKLIPTSTNLKRYLRAVKNENEMANLYGQIVVDKIKDLQEFSEMWRKHFVDTMNPKYLPKGWSIEKRVLRDGKL